MKRNTPVEKLRAAAKAEAKQREKSRPGGILNESEAAVNLLDVAKRYYRSKGTIDSQLALKRLIELADEYGDVSGFWSVTR